jgi:hypothetical protein
MARNQNHQANQHASDAVDRYRQAAEVALQQLDWTANYLHRIRKPEIARSLAKNHAHIRRRLIDRPE